MRPNGKHASVRSVAEKHAQPSPAVHPGPISTRPRDLRSAENCFLVEQVDFAELENGSLLEIIEAPTDPNQTLFAVSRRGRIRLVEEVKDRGRVLVPMSRNTLGLFDVKLPRGVLPYKSATRLVDTLKLFIREVVDIPDDYALLLSAFVLYTWVADRLPTAVYLSIIGLPQSGKSTLLELLSLLCRRALLVNDISQAAAYQACSKFGPTLLIDEIEWHSLRTRGNFQQLLRAGTGRSSRALRVGKSSTAFGPKVFGSLEASSDPALNTRCIQLVMAETTNRGLLKPGDPSVMQSANDLRHQLLKFRFNSYHSIRPALVQGAEQLRPRSRDLLSTLAAPLVKSPSHTRFLFEFIKTKHDPVTREPLDAGREALNASVWAVVHRAREIPAVRVGGESSLSTATNLLLAEEGERLRLTDKAVGRILASLGYRSTKRTNAGWWLLIDSVTVARCHQLCHTYGNKYVPPSEFAPAFRYLLVVPGIVRSE